MRNYPTLSEIRAAHAPRKEYERYLLSNRYLFRPLGFLATWLALRLGLSSETISWFSLVTGSLGLLCLATESHTLVLLGIGLLCGFNLLDCIDGSIARVAKTQNPYGRFLDSVCGGIVDLAFWAVVGILSIRHPETLLMANGFGLGSHLWLTVGIVTAFFNGILVYIERAYDELLNPAWEALRARTSPSCQPTSAEHTEPPLVYLIRHLTRNLRVRETQYPLLFAAISFRLLDLLLIVYLVFYSMHALAAILLYARRGRAILLSQRSQAR